jgi:hypothetical protein
LRTLENDPFAPPAFDDLHRPLARVTREGDEHREPGRHDVGAVGLHRREGAALRDRRGEALRLQFLEPPARDRASGLA